MRPFRVFMSTISLDGEEHCHVIAASREDAEAHARVVIEEEAKAEVGESGSVSEATARFLASPAGEERLSEWLRRKGEFSDVVEILEDQGAFVLEDLDEEVGEGGEEEDEEEDEETEAD